MEELDKLFKLCCNDSTLNPSNTITSINMVSKTEEYKKQNGQHYFQKHLKIS